MVVASQSSSCEARHTPPARRARRHDRERQGTETPCSTTGPGELTVSGSVPGIPWVTYLETVTDGVSRSRPADRSSACRAHWA